MDGMRVRRKGERYDVRRRREWTRGAMASGLEGRYDGKSWSKRVDLSIKARYSE